MKKNNIRVKRIIQRCGCDAILPLTLVYIFYIILHGHLSPGGGFQGGVLMVAAVLLIYLGHGYRSTIRAMRPDILRKLEGVALIAYIAIAMLGVIYGAQFCQNVLFDNGPTGVSILVLSMLGVLLGKDVDNNKKK